MRKSLLEQSYNVKLFFQPMRPTQIIIFFRARFASQSSQKDSTIEQSAEEFFIDVILQRHARKLLSSGRLFDLGTFAAQLGLSHLTPTRYFCPIKLT